MKFQVTATAFVIAVVMFCPPALAVDDWAVYKAKYNKTYTGDEDVLRRSIWQANMKDIDEHNEMYAQGRTSFYLKENTFTDMSLTEVSTKFKGYIPKDEDVKIESTVNDGVMSKASDLPESVDWRLNGSVTRVKNQGQCGSCWAFSVVGAVEGQHFKVNGTLVSLSESNLVDCSSSHGCIGSSRVGALQYIIDNKGIATEWSYPYVAKEGPCKVSSSIVGAKIDSYRILPSGDEIALQRAVATVGPVSVSIDANHSSFAYYGGGVQHEPNCSRTRLDHAVLVVGYGTLNYNDYWIVKNSWGELWGNKGYILMSRNKGNACGIATNAIYPIIGSGQGKLRHFDLYVLIYLLLKLWL